MSPCTNEGEEMKAFEDVSSPHLNLPPYTFPGPAQTLPAGLSVAAVT